MWPDSIVLFQPDIDDDLSLFNCREPFGVEDFSSERSIEPFIVTVLPRTAGKNGMRPIGEIPEEYLYSGALVRLFDKYEILFLGKSKIFKLTMKFKCGK